VREAVRPATPPTSFRRDLARSRRLFAAFRQEQSNPAYFYGLLADDAVAHLALRGGGAQVLSIDADATELTLHGRTPGPGAILGSGIHLPLRTASVDVCLSTNVLEHVPDPTAMADEMLRVTRPGGTMFLSYTNWLSPWGGHETSPWHYLGGPFAARRYRRRTGHQPKNLYGATMYPVSVAQVIRWAGRQTGADVIEMLPRYLPVWAAGIVRVPVLREFLTWNLVVILRKR